MHFIEAAVCLMTIHCVSFLLPSPVNEDLQIFSYADQLPLSEIIHQVGNQENTRIG